MIVLDCSYTMAMVMPDESRPSSLAQTELSRLFAPSLWVFEVANALRIAVRRGRLAANQAAALSTRLDAYGVGVDGATASVHQRYIAAQTHDLTAYDACYIDLALQRGFALATLDARLAAQARRLGLTVYQ